VAVSTILRGWALTMQGRAEEGLTHIRQALAVLQTVGTKQARTYHLAVLAEAYGHAGRAQEALQVLAEALELVDAIGAHVYEAELHRLKGECLLVQTRSEPRVMGTQQQVFAAVACFRRALEVARHQQAKLWELRAAMGLSRLWQRQGKRDEARQLLAEMYAWFTQGFDTADLQEAKALLDELA
jgi:predicted ATPase